MERRTRKPIRLEDYDYSRNGAYFVTVCTKDKMCIFWESKNKYNPIDINVNAVGAVIGRPHTKIRLSEYGKHVKISLNNIHAHYPDVYVDKYVIMPNHIHLIIDIDNPDIGRTQFAPTISRIIKQFKGAVTKQIGFSLWQRSFYDRIIRNGKEYSAYWQYIENNPINWESDELFCEYSG